MRTSSGPSHSRGRLLGVLHEADDVLAQERRRQGGRRAQELDRLAGRCVLLLLVLLCCVESSSLTSTRTSCSSADARDHRHPPRVRPRPFRPRASERASEHRTDGFPSRSQRLRLLARVDVGHPEGAQGAHRAGGAPVRRPGVAAGVQGPARERRRGRGVPARAPARAPGLEGQDLGVGVPGQQRRAEAGVLKRRGSERDSGWTSGRELNSTVTV